MGGGKAAAPVWLYLGALAVWFAPAVLSAELYLSSPANTLLLMVAFMNVDLAYRDAGGSLAAQRCVSASRHRPSLAHIIRMTPFTLQPGSVSANGSEAHFEVSC